MWSQPSAPPSPPVSQAAITAHLYPFRFPFPLIPWHQWQLPPLTAIAELHTGPFLSPPPYLSRTKVPRAITASTSPLPEPPPSLPRCHHGRPWPMSSPISLHPPPPASISPPTASHRHHEPSPLLLVANPHQQHLPPVLAGSHRLRATLAANTTKKVYAEEGSAHNSMSSLPPCTVCNNLHTNLYYFFFLIPSSKLKLVLPSTLWHDC